MFIYLISLNFYFRIFVFAINPAHIWHWRLPAQGLLNEIVAAGLFYLFFKILWYFIPRLRGRRVVFLALMTVWIAVNYINYEYSRVFNMLLPLSWFREIANVAAMDGGGDILKGLWRWEVLLLLVLPLVLTVWLVLARPPYLFEKAGIGYLLGVFIFCSLAQSATLFPDIQPKRDSIIESHLLKYWYYDYRHEPFPKARQAPLPSFSADFHRIVLTPAERDTDVLPELQAVRPNVVLILLESFRAFETGAFGSTLGITPHFDRYAARGVLCKNIYSTGAMTKYGLWSILCGSHKHAGEAVLTSYP